VEPVESAVLNGGKPGNVAVRINCIGQLGLGLLPLGPQPIRVRVGEAQLLVLLPSLGAALLAAGLTLMG
jgi:hypothetical protein